MLKRITFKKIMVTTSALLVLFLVYLMPTENLERMKEEVNYVDTTVMEHDVFLLNQKGYLARAKVQITQEKNKELLAKELLTYLILESSLESKIPSGFKAFLPSETQIKSVGLENGVLKVDFSKELLNIDEKLEEKMVEAITFTLTSIDEVENVILYVDGTILTKLPKTGKYLPSTLNRTIGINKEYDISSYKDVNKVTVYYVDSFNDYFYYVPVTKYVNDSRDKIHIIIDELASNSNYNTNLMSFLNSNTKLLSVSQKEDRLDLVFNSYIFDDMDEKYILEEVLYTICISVADNYDVEEVSFTVGDQEIYKSVLKTLE